jgi:hypothetical protein
MNMKFAWQKTVVVFVAGALLGVTGTFYGMRFQRHENWRDVHKVHEHMLRQFTAKLSLTATQQKEVSRILTDTRQQMEAMRQEIHPRFQAIKETSRARIRALLNPDQQKRFDALGAEMEARFSKRRGSFAESR